MIDSGQHLIVLFFSYSPDDPTMEIRGSSVGQLVLVGIVILPYNRFLYSTPLAVFVSRDSGANEILNRIGLGDRIRVKGSLWDFNGKKEIKLKRSGDLEKINPL